jgi:hypothetical protein
MNLETVISTINIPEDKILNVYVTVSNVRRIFSHVGLINTFNRVLESTARMMRILIGKKIKSIFVLNSKASIF